MITFAVEDKVKHSYFSLGLSRLPNENYCIWNKNVNKCRNMDRKMCS